MNSHVHPNPLNLPGNESHIKQKRLAIPTPSNQHSGSIYGVETPIQEMIVPPPKIGWYLHLPFCKTKCGYCDFYSLPTIPNLIGDLVRSIRREISQRDPRRPVETVFIGGGTPTELPDDALASILEIVLQRTGPVREWTVEANPTSAKEAKLEVLGQHGVNRISFGAQSFHPDELKVLERLHDPGHIEESVRAARAVGMDNVNLDLIYAIPGQTIDRWRDSLRRAIDLETEHLSCYALMYEPGTSLTKLRLNGRIISCEENLEAEMFEATIEELTKAGFEHYEISNFAKPGRRCRANIIYWQNCEYVGIGPSAVSYLDGVRRKNIADVRRYVELMKSDATAIVAEQEQLPALERAGETAVQMLRLTHGIDIKMFRNQTGFDPREIFTEPIERFTEIDLITQDDQSIRLTRHGMLLANRVMEDFLLGTEASRTKIS